MGQHRYGSLYISYLFIFVKIICFGSIQLHIYTVLKLIHLFTWFSNSVLLSGISISTSNLFFIKAFGIQLSPMQLKGRNNAKGFQKLIARSTYFVLFLNGGLSKIISK